MPPERLRHVACRVAAGERIDYQPAGFRAKLDKELWKRGGKTRWMNFKACCTTRLDVLRIALVVAALDDICGDGATTIYLEFVGDVMTGRSDLRPIPPLD